MKWHNQASFEERRRGTEQGSHWAGVEGTPESVEWLWNKHFSAVGGDANVFEAWPAKDERYRTSYSPSNSNRPQSRCSVLQIVTTSSDHSLIIQTCRPPRRPPRPLGNPHWRDVRSRAAGRVMPQASQMEFLFHERTVEFPWRNCESAECGVCFVEVVEQ